MMWNPNIYHDPSGDPLIGQVCVGLSMSKGVGGLLSKLICRIDGSRASHAWILYHDMNLQTWMVLEAHETEVRAVTYSLFCKRNNIVSIRIPKFSIDAGLPKAASLLGEKYDFAGLFGMAIVLLGRRLKKKWKNPFRSSHSQFCTDFVANVFISAKFPGTESADPETTDIKDIDAWLADSVEFRPEV